MKIHIDSLNRDTSFYPNRNFFKIDLQYLIKEGKILKLIGGIIPASSSQRYYKIIVKEGIHNEQITNITKDYHFIIPCYHPSNTYININKEEGIENEIYIKKNTKSLTFEIYNDSDNLHTFSNDILLIFDLE